MTSSRELPGQVPNSVSIEIPQQSTPEIMRENIAKLERLNEKFSGNLYRSFGQGNKKVLVFPEFIQDRFGEGEEVGSNQKSFKFLVATSCDFKLIVMSKWHSTAEAEMRAYDLSNFLKKKEESDNGKNEIGYDATNRTLNLENAWQFRYGARRNFFTNVFQQLVDADQHRVEEILQLNIAKSMGKQRAAQRANEILPKPS